MTRKICVVTGSRSEYGLLRWVMEEIRASSDLQLQVVVTGMHLAPEFGLTYRELESDGFVIDRKVEMLVSSDSRTAMTKSMGLGLIGIGDAFAQLLPDIVVVLGDRFEIFPAATAAMAAGIPIAHLHGGEVTLGAFDEAIRHAITKMAHLHFVAAEAYRNRVIQMGERPERVFLVGALGLDNIERLPLWGRDELERELGISLGRRSLLITFHPATLDQVAPERQMGELLGALAGMEDATLVFTMPNADPGGRRIFEMIEEFVGSHPNAHFYRSLGQLRYLSCMRHVDGVIGNSSSALIEAPAFKKGAVNIGDRQQGRIRAASVLDCVPERHQIAAAIERLRAPDFMAKLANLSNPYGIAGASKRIVEELAHVSLDNILKKDFFDIPVLQER